MIQFGYRRIILSVFCLISLSTTKGFADLIQEYLNSQLTLKGQLEWVPNGGLMAPVPTDCLPEKFETLARQNHLSAFYFAQITENYFKRCEKILSRKATGGLPGLSEFALAQYPFLEHSKIKKITFSLQNGRRLNGFIAVKDLTPRPWVIFKCGVFCSAEENAASIKNFMIHYFDQSPFNVIILGNRTGDDYITENKVFNFGGYFDSVDFLEVANWLKFESQYRKTVSSIHLVGVSLGGSAAYLSESAISESHESNALIQSISSICAVSDLKPTVNDMFGDTAKGNIFSHITWKKLQSYKPFLIEAGDLITENKPQLSLFPDLLGKIIERYIPSHEVESDKISKFWELNYFSHRTHNSKVPLLIWASADDSVVNYKINTEILRKINSTKKDFNRAIIQLPKGEHCGFATAYGYSVTSTVLRSFILNNSTEFQPSDQSRLIPFKIQFPDLSEGEKIVGYIWNAHPKNINQAQLTFYIYGSNNSLCPEKNAFLDHSNCYRTISFDISTDFFSLYGFTKPKNLTETQSLARELNARITLLNNNNFTIESEDWPNQIWIRF
jgi:hypothetical protein